MHESLMNDAQSKLFIASFSYGYDLSPKGGLRKDTIDSYCCAWAGGVVDLSGGSSGGSIIISGGTLLSYYIYYGGTWVFIDSSLTKIETSGGDCWLTSLST